MASDYEAFLAGLAGGGTSGGVQSTEDRFLGSGVYGTAPDAGYDIGSKTSGPGTRRDPINGTGPGGVATSGIGSTGQGYAQSDVNNILKGMSPEMIATIQRQMGAIGLLPENFKSFGFVEDTTRKGFEELLGVANDRQTNWSTAIEGLAETAKAGAGRDTIGLERSERARKQILRAAERDEKIAGFTTRTDIFQRSDPASLRVTAEEAFRQALGRKPTKAEQERFVGSFLKDERAIANSVTGSRDRIDAADRDRALGSFDATTGVLEGVDGAGGDPVDRVLSAIGGQESGNDYGARNGRTGASGKYQVMPANWGPWSAQAGLGANAPRTPENQEKVARYKMGEYIEKYGEQGAMVAWYGGPGAADAWLKNPNAARFNRKQGKGNEPSINEYVQQVSSKMGGGASGGGGQSQSDLLWEKLQQLIADAPGKVTPGKRTRSYEEQVKLYENYKNGTGPLAAKPGTSLHSDGRANDLKYENQATKRWVLENAGKYGLAFPLLKAGEDWHVEMAGEQPHAEPGGGGGAASAPISETVTQQQQNPAAQALEFARNSNPTETKAFDIGGQFQNLVGILSKGIL